MLENIKIQNYGSYLLTKFHKRLELNKGNLSQNYKFKNTSGSFKNILINNKVKLISYASNSSTIVKTYCHEFQRIYVISILQRKE